MPNPNDTYIIALQQYHISDNCDLDDDDDDAIRQGHAVVRSVAQFAMLDASLRDEAIPINVPFPSTPYHDYHQALQQYLHLILQLRQVVHSNALADFFTVRDMEVTAEDGATEDSTTPLQCIEYLLPAIQSPTHQPIPRFGSSKTTTDTIQPGWWLVWYLQSDVSVEFEVFIVPTCENGEAHHNQQQQQQQYLVHQETTCELQKQQQQQRQQTTKHCCSFGSYRILSDPSLAVMTVTGRSMLMTGGPKFVLEWDTVPHLAFVAACTAAKESMVAAEKRRRAPLLSRLMEYSNHDPGDVGFIRVLPREGTRASGEATVPLDDCEVNVLSDKLLAMEKEIQRWKTYCEDLKNELAKSQTRIQTINQQLETASSERRVWNVVRSELQLELSRLSQEAEMERKEKNRTVLELQEVRQELREVGEQVTLAALQVGNNPSIYMNGSKNQLAELTQAMWKVEGELLTERSKNAKLKRKEFLESRPYAFACIF